MLLAESRKDEIGMWNRQKLELRLGPPGRPLAPHAARTHCDFGLNHLITVAFRVGGRIQEGSQPRLLIVLKEVPSNGQSKRQGGCNDGQVLPSKSREKDTGGQNRKVGEGR